MGRRDDDRTDKAREKRRDYYEISTCAEFAYITNDTTGNWYRFNYILTNDLILNDTILTWDESGNLINDPATLHRWTPFYREFSGIFDGGGHTISGAYVHTGDNYASLFAYVSGTVKSLNVVNSSISGARFCGGIIGEATPNCPSFSGLVFSGVVNGTENIGGGVGQCRSSGSVANCVNYGHVFGSKGYIGGISGDSYSDFINCSNFGKITGTRTTVGGIVGRGRNGSCISCCNHGAINSTGSSGGIIGLASNQPIKSCCNTAPVNGVYYSSGIVAGLEQSMSIVDCYNTGAISCTGGGSNAGAIVGTDGAVWGKDTIIGCYYLKTDTVNADLYGCSGVNSPDAEPEGFRACSVAEMQTQSTYIGWDFENTWGISTEKNGGYPYLLNSNENDDPAEEYRIGTLIICDMDGAALTAIPSGQFLVTIPITKMSEGGDSLILLAAYGPNGQYRGTMYVNAKGIKYGNTVEITLPIDNTKGEITQLKAFCIASFNNPVPIGAASVFPAQ